MILLATYGVLIGNTSAISPTLRYVGNGIIHGYRLECYNHLTVTKAKGMIVNVAVYELTDEEIAKTDGIEAAPYYYQRHQVKIEMETGEWLDGQVYVMSEENKVGYPNTYYINACYSAYDSVKLSTKQLDKIVDSLS